MSDIKLSSHEVPGKFTEWLLAMGSPAEQVPSVETLAEMCRGQYYMVWRSLMEQVDAKDVIRKKRLQVFCDDIRKCHENNVYNKGDARTYVPEQLSLWQEQAQLRRKVQEAQARVGLAHKDLDQVLDKNNSKLSQREVSRRRITDRSRRVWFLQQVAAELQQKATDLKETRAIADSLCSLNTDEDDLQNNLERCIALFKRQHMLSLSALSASNTSAVSVNGEHDLEEQVWLASRGGGAALCSRLLERRAQLTPLTQTAAVQPTAQQITPTHKLTPQSVLAHTDALHCTLALEGIKNNLHLKQTRQKLAATVNQLNNYLTNEFCELLVLQCERTSGEARVTALRGLLDEIAASSGPFAVEREDSTPPGVSLGSVNKAIESKRDEIKRVLSLLSNTERKLQRARECLAATLASDPVPTRTGVVQEPVDSVSSLREVYAARRRRVNLSLELDASEHTDYDCSKPRFVDELRIYLKKFNLDNNRQLVLDNGEKIYIFETMQSSIQRLHSKWLQDDLPCCLLSPGDSLTNNIKKLVDYVAARADWETMLRSLKSEIRIPEIDVTPQRREEEALADKTKKRLSESLTDLQRVLKTFASSREDLQLWADNNNAKYLSGSRKIDGMSYKDYERCYLENFFSV